MTQPLQPQNPAKLGRYEIVDELGKGAMGVVYLARDPLIGRQVALKTFRIGYSVRDAEAEQFRARFMREAQSAGILSHPNIVTVHDVVEESAGLSFIAMEYVQGTNLKHLLQRDQPLPLSFVAMVIEQVSNALDYAHSRGVVHRDVKPANIIITADDKVKITDFGIARLDTSNLTQEGQLLGTPNYMAPEQILGHEVDHRADIFSLGVVLYEMLTRRKPFQGENLTVVSHRIVYDSFTPPRQYVENLPPELERVLARALEKDPAKRYQKARELAGELRRAVAAVAAVQAASLAGDALNETQNLSATIAVPPAAAALGPRRSRRPLSWEVSPVRAARVAGVAFAIGLLLGASALLWVGWTQPAVPVEPNRTEREDVIELLQKGHGQLREGRWEEAAQSYGEAERLAPDLPGPRRMREAAERKQTELAALVAREAVGARLELAREALAQQRLDDAAVAASAVLLTDVDNAEASQILAQVDQAKARRRTAPAARAPAGGKPPAPRPQSAETAADLRPAPAAPAAAEPQPIRGTVTFHFYTELPKGLFRVYRGRRIVTDAPFDFYDRAGLRKIPGEGSVDFSLKDVLAGEVAYLVLVTPDGGKAQTEQVTVKVRGGATTHVDIRLSANGEMMARSY